MRPPGVVRSHSFLPGSVKAVVSPLVSTVSFVWDYFGRNIDMKFAAGSLGVDHDNGSLAPRLGFAVVEQ